MNVSNLYLLVIATFALFEGGVVGQPLPPPPPPCWPPSECQSSSLVDGQCIVNDAGAFDEIKQQFPEVKFLTEEQNSELARKSENPLFAERPVSDTPIEFPSRSKRQTAPQSCQKNCGWRLLNIQVGVDGFFDFNGLQYIPVGGGHTRQYFRTCTCSSPNSWCSYCTGPNYQPAQCIAPPFWTWSTAGAIRECKQKYTYQAVVVVPIGQCGNVLTPQVLIAPIPTDCCCDSADF